MLKISRIARHSAVITAGSSSRLFVMITVAMFFLLFVMCVSCYIYIVHENMNNVNRKVYYIVTNVYNYLDFV